MRLTLRRMGIALGALVEAGLIIWLVGGFLPAGWVAGALAIGLGAAIYLDILRRDSARGGR